MTLKVQSLGTNTYLALGDRNTQEFRLNYVGDSYTYSELPIEFDIHDIWARGDAATGIIEVIGIQRD